ncbi:hypothetical protein EV359DRAFT_84163 [Lentinula novae-zelandiae]|nr:hypothetical protein EV359DRAFT_84163 [Lentinula novae-zelandiae]
MLRLLCICGCKAASHIHMKAPRKETNTPPTASLKTPSPIFPSGSATTKAMSNSRSSSADSSFTACPFHDHLKTRKECTEGTESAKDGASPLFSSTSKSRFDPADADVGQQAKSESPSELSPPPPPVADPKVTSDTEEVKFFDIEEFKPADFLVLICMLENMTAPIQNGPFPYSWWTPEGTTHFQYTGFGITTTSIITAFRQYKSRSLPDVHFARIINILSEDVLYHMKDFFDLSQCILEETWGSEQHNLFDLVFSLGPGGIDLVVKFLMTLFEEVEASEQTFITKFYNEELQVFTQLWELPTCLVHLVCHFRSVTWRALWDPKDGFSQFSIMLKRYGGLLPPGRSNSIFIHDLTAIKLYSSSVPEIAASLNKVFGDITDSTKIYPQALCSGKYGLHYFFDHLVKTVLDVLEVGGRRYPKILKLFESLCRALADRLKAQITGSSWTCSSPAPPTSTSYTPSFTDHSSNQSSSVSL